MNPHIIHLTSSQKECWSFHNDLLEDVEEVPSGEMSNLLDQHIAGDRTATDRLILGNMHLVRLIVGRFLRYWPEARRFTDDLCSEGLLATTEVVQTFLEPDTGKLQAFIVVTIKKRIEEYLNNNRSIFSPSLSTNYRRLRNGQSPEYPNSVPALEPAESEKHHEFARYDQGPVFVDMLDSLDHISEADSEEIVNLVLACLESDHQVLESSLTHRQQELIHGLVKIGGRHAA